uniref:C1q domain-containing protein n=1 Tax=Sinocyclocheilus anshuiensis TaxID=1608454 RepID=A0A671NJM6_9TELE
MYYHLHTHNKGEPGLEGPTGEQGPKGDDGQSQGQTGEKGEKGNLGPTGEQGTTGATGPKGDQGDMGMTGMPGPCSPTVQSTFSAALLTSLPQPSRPVPFKRVIYNLNQNYNPDNGVYTAPVNGTYVFSYHLQVATRALKVGLFHNFEAVVRTTTPVEMNTASQQVVLSLSQGDWVWVQVKDVTTNGMYTGSEASSTFSGFLLYPDRFLPPCGTSDYYKNNSMLMCDLTNIVWCAYYSGDEIHVTHTVRCPSRTRKK